MRFSMARGFRNLLYGLTALTGITVHGQAANKQLPTDQSANPLDKVPAVMPYATPYGSPVTLGRAGAIAQAAQAEAERRGWSMAIAVVDSSGNLVIFRRMDNAALASTEIALHKARVSAKYRRPTKVFEDLLQKPEYHYLLTLDDLIASRGGIPLIEDGKLVGAIGCSSGTSSQDEVVCTAGAKTINK